MITIHFLFNFAFIRAKLEFFEQACSVDSVTKKCAGRPSSCRQALLGILGTVLRTTCACQGADQQFMYRCLGWRKLLWVNPCVGKYWSYILLFWFGTLWLYSLAKLIDGLQLWFLHLKFLIQHLIYSNWFLHRVINRGICN